MHNVRLAGTTTSAIFAPMRSLYRTGAFALLLVAGLPQAAPADPLSLEGEIQRGDTLVHRFEKDDGKFEIRMVPVQQGWGIWVGDPSDRQRNYVIVATPPFRGINPAVIQGWHFRNSDNTGPNRAGEDHVNAPGRIRTFAFVLDGAGYQAAHEALDILMWPEGREASEIDAARTRLDAVPKANVTLEIEALELGNLVEGQKAWIERLAFRLQIDHP